MKTFNEEFSKIKERYRSGQDMRKIYELKEKLLKKQIVLFGLGFFGVPLYKNLVNQGIRPVCFCDSKKSGCEKETGLSIIAPAQLQQDYADANVVISVANPNNQDSIFKQLLGLGFDKERIFTFGDAFKFLRKSVVEITSLTLDELQEYLDGYGWCWNFFEDRHSRKVIHERICSYLFNDTLDYERIDPMYFPAEMFAITGNEVFVDAGLYTGDTTLEFMRITGGKYRGIYGFDIDTANADIAGRNLSSYDNVHIVSKGLWSNTVRLNANLELAAGSNIGEAGSAVIPAVSLDDFFTGVDKENLPTFIKMDIEGSEKEALLGSANIIKTTRPKLAICAYHKPEDLYELPRTILGIRNDYRFALRHYSPYTWDTVLYAC
jgi:FkbM family methyltransferase